MKTEQLIEKARQIAEPFRVNKGKDFRLKNIIPGETLGLGSGDKPRAQEALSMGIEALAELQGSSFRPWTPLVRMVPSSTSFRRQSAGLPSRLVQVTVRR